MTHTSELFEMDTVPMRIGTVRLRVRDLEKISAFYRTALGLAETARDGSHVVLGTGTTPLLELAGDPSLVPNDRRQAGLFHTAFLLPERADLGRWMDHARASGIRLQGASDHIVSEALYLADPEGNGIEIYADRPVPLWRSADGNIQMTTEPLDVQDLLASAEGTGWSGFPDAGTIGHVHLQVGDTAAADSFYRDILGFETTVDYPGASFYGSGGYHHQLAGNIWNSRRAGARPTGMAGLDRVEIVVRDRATIDVIAARAESAGSPIVNETDGITLHDPWGTAIALRN